MNVISAFLKSAIGQLHRSAFARSVLTMLTGTAASQAVVMAFAPILTRLYGPEAYGLQGLYMSIVAVFAIVAGLGYPTAVVLPRSEIDALGLLRLAFYGGLISTAAIALILVAVGSHALALLNADALIGFAYLIPLGVLATLAGAITEQWLIRHHAFRIVAVSGFLAALLINLVKLVAGSFWPSAFALIVANVIGAGLGAVFGYLGWRLSHARHWPRTNQGPHKLLRLAKAYMEFPLVRTPQNLLNALSHNLPIIMLASFFGPAEVGQYGVAVAVLGVPIMLIGNSISAVFYPRIAQAVRDGENPQALLLKITLGMLAAGILPFAVVACAGPPLFSLVFGAAWHRAGEYSQWLVLWLFGQYLNKPAVAASPALRLQHVLLVHEVLGTALKLGALFVGCAVFNDDLIAIAVYSGCGALVYLSFICWMLWRSGTASENGSDAVHVD